MSQSYDYDSARELVQSKKLKSQERFKNKPSTPHERKPDWLKVKLKSNDEYKEVSSNLRSKSLWTVCEEALCPNKSECWSAKTATMMILGGTCTRACKFCNVDTGNPQGIVDENEIKNASEMVKVMSLRYLVVTSVDRDDLSDFGAGHFANVVSEINKNHPDTKVEVLIPDFDADETHMHTLAKSSPFVIAQNIETVKRLTHPVRDRRAGYHKTLSCLNFYKTHYPHIHTKSSIMLGLGETEDEVIDTMKDLRSVGCTILTLGQYLRPSLNQLPVEKYYHPREFEFFKEKAYELGFEFVASGPLVRSSYKAADFLKYLESKNDIRLS